MTVTKQILLYLVIFYLAILIFVYFFADRFIFYPPPSSYHDTSEIIKLKTADGAIISAVYLPNPKAKFTILYSHGNATDIGELYFFFKILHDHGFSVFAYDYHGYGTSTGKPGEKNAYRDIDAAYNYLIQSLQIPPQQIIAYGQSVGAAVALDLATRQPLAGLIIESPFVTAFRTLTYFSLLPFDKFDNISKIKKVNCPILLIHGTRDKVIPIWHGKKLFAAAKSPKFFVWLEGLDHNDLPTTEDDYWRALKEFVEVINKNG